MQKTFRHIIVWSLAGLLLVGQTGISLHKIYCYCKGEWTSSVFAEANSGCEDHREKDTQGLPSCCQHFSECSLNAPQDSQFPCTEDFVVYLQLDQTAPPAQTDNRTISSGLDLQAVMPGFTIFLPPSFAIQTPVLPDYPPPNGLDGRAIRILVRSFLC